MCGESCREEQRLCGAPLCLSITGFSSHSRTQYAPSTQTMSQRSHVKSHTRAAARRSFVHPPRAPSPAPLPTLRPPPKNHPNRLGRRPGHRQYRAWPAYGCCGQALTRFTVTPVHRARPSTKATGGTQDRPIPAPSRLATPPNGLFGPPFPQPSSSRRILGPSRYACTLRSCSRSPAHPRPRDHERP